MLGIFPKQHQKLACALFAATLSFTITSAAEFVPLGDLPGGDNLSVAFDLSGDGSTVLGVGSDDAGMQVFRWRLETGFLLITPFDAQTISGDGSTVAGSAFTDRLSAALWTESSGLVSLESPPIDPSTSPFTVALDISGDNSTAVGVGATLASPFSEGLLWNSEGVRELGFLEDDLPEPGFFSFSFANAVSADGTVVVGASSSTKHMDRGEQAYRWTDATGMQPLGFLPGAFESQATVVSAGGAVVAGTSGGQAFRWTGADGMEAIGPFLPLGISEDGSVIVGRADTELGSAAYVWTAAEGPLPLATWLEQKHDLATSGWILSEAIGISDDGSKIAGTGINPSGNSEAFLVVLNGEKDSDGDGVVDSEDANPNSDLRPTVFVGGVDTGLGNPILPGGVTLNDAIVELMNSAASRNEFLHLLNKAIKVWVDAGALAPNEKHILMAAAREAEQPGWTSAGKRK